MNRRAVLTAALLGATAVGGTGWAVAQGMSGGTQPATPVEAKLAQPAEAPAKKPTPHPVDPTQAAKARAAIDQAVAELSTKLGCTPAELQAASEKVSQQIKPTESEALTMRTGTTDEKRRVLKSLEGRALTSLAKELKVDRAALATAVNEVKASQVKAHESEIKAAMAQAVAEGKISQAEATLYWTLLTEHVIGG